ncbi:MAG: glycosyltransferase family 4 protein [Phycisphaeraceae bacterium]
MASNDSPWASLQAAALIGSYVPRRCGIGTFSADLAEALAATAPHLNTWAVAMNDRPEGYRYPPRVWFEINQNRLGEYRLAADYLNMSNINVVSLQHEYGLFGGNCGQYILELLRRLRMPAVTTLHTVLKEPSDAQRDILMQIADVSDRLVVMADRAYEFLTDIYKVPREKIQLIHHGIPDVPFVDPNFFKDQFGVEGKKVVLTFGLLSPNKGIENMVEALPHIVKKHPDLVYIVLGATHPGVMAHSGEDYRLGLKQRAKELGVADHIEFVNKFVETDELLEFLGAADVYVTPYLNEAQITSGTLAYALGTGKATVSTPYWYAQEMLGDDRGILVPFKDAKALAEGVNRLFDNETERHAMRKRAYQFTRQMRWQEVAGQYLDLFSEVRDERRKHPRPPHSSSRELRNIDSELSEIKLDHLTMLSDDVGIMRHAKFTIPDRHSGYATDDNARALVTVLLAQDHVRYTSGVNLDAMLCRCLSFLDHALDTRSGRFRAVMRYDRTWHGDDEHSEDVHARTIWALGEAVARCQVRGHRTLAANLFQRSVDACEKFKHPLAWADALIGIHAYLRRFSGDTHARRIRESLAERLLDRFKQNAGDDWAWPTNEVTYTAARLPHALLLSGRWMFNDEMIQTALHSLEWLWQVQTGAQGQFAPVGTEGHFPRGGVKARFAQQPIEAYVTLDACLEAFRVTDDKQWPERAHRCLTWFLGDNDLRLPLYDHTTGGCHDGLHAQGLHENQSAQATLAWLLSLLSQYEHNFETLQPRADGQRKQHGPRDTEPATPNGNSVKPAPDAKPKA